MYLPDNQDPDLRRLADQSKGLSEDLLRDLPSDGSPIHLDSTSDLLASQPPVRLFRLVAGQLRMLQDGKLIAIMEPGDLVGLSRSLQLPEGTLQSDAPIEIIPYQRDALLRHVGSSEALQRKWTYYLVCLANFFRNCFAQLIPSQFKPAMGFLDFEVGETIIRQGDDADCVYTLLEGSAEAFRNGIKVGEIHAQEIFGAMAVFTRQKRGATVKATSNCSVLAVQKEQFLDLVVQQPQVCLDLIEEMADKINQLNQQVLELQT
jgi:CRP/FNR family cyclic AMP-dependent transcriptional regulator